PRDQPTGASAANEHPLKDSPMTSAIWPHRVLPTSSALYSSATEGASPCDALRQRATEASWPTVSADDDPQHAADITVHTGHRRHAMRCPPAGRAGLAFALPARMS